MKAIVKTGPKHAELVDDVPVPKLRSGYILVRVVAVAVNPTDWKAIDYMASEGITIGVDFAGIVEEVGDGVTKHFKKGDRICGFVQGANDSHPEDGTHAEYVLAKGEV
jgi:NADPH:quinone reductase-like Zn-dependent oxidoreductase